MTLPADPDRDYAAARKTLRKTLKLARRARRQMTRTERQKLRRAALVRAQAAQVAAAAYAALPDRPCPTCVNHCCSSPYAAGYFHGLKDFHPDVVAGKVHLESFMLPPTDAERPTWGEPDYTYEIDETTGYRRSIPTGRTTRCFFLSPTGCNIPPPYRSSTCLSFQCGQLDRAVQATGQPSPNAAFLRAVWPVNDMVYRIGVRPPSATE